MEKYIVEPNYNAIYAVIKQYDTNNKNIVNKILRAQDKAVEYFRSNQTTAKKILTKYTALDKNLSTKVGVGYPLLSTDKIDYKKVQEYADLLYGEGDIKNKVNTENLFKD